MLGVGASWSWHRSIVHRGWMVLGGTNSSLKEVLGEINGGKSFGDENGGERRI